MAVGKSGGGIAGRCPCAAIPDHHGASPIGLLRYHAFKLRIVERMVLRPDGEAAGGGIRTRALRDRPAEQHAIHFEPEVEMQPSGRMGLHDKRQRPLAGHLARSS